jgi:hypothetical protein
MPVAEGMKAPPPSAWMKRGSSRRPIALDIGQRGRHNGLVDGCHEQTDGDDGEDQPAPFEGLGTGDDRAIMLNGPHDAIF